MANSNMESNLTEQTSRTISITDRTGTDPYMTKDFVSKIWAPEEVVLPGASGPGNITSASGNGLTSQNDPAYNKLGKGAL